MQNEDLQELDSMLKGPSQEQLIYESYKILNRPTRLTNEGRSTLQEIMEKEYDQKTGETTFLANQEENLVNDSF